MDDDCQEKFIMIRDQWCIMYRVPDLREVLYYEEQYLELQLVSSKVIFKLADVISVKLRLL